MLSVGRRQNWRHNFLGIKKCPPKNREGKKVSFYLDAMFWVNFNRSESCGINFCRMDLVFIMYCRLRKIERKICDFYRFRLHFEDCKNCII